MKVEPVADEARETAAPDAGGTWTRRVPFLGLLAAAFISAMGSNFTAVAIPWFVLVTTGSAAKTGVTLAFYTLPIVITGIFGGALVDRLGFVRTSILSDLGGAVTMALIPLLYHTVGLAFWELLLLVFVRSMLVNPGGTARMSLVADLAEQAGTTLERANSLTSGAQRLALLLGPPAAGLLIAFMGVSNVLWLDAASFMLSAMIFAAAIVGRVTPRSQPSTRQSYLRETLDGFRFLRRDRLLLWLVLTVALSSLISEPFYIIILPVYAKEIYGRAVDLGLMFSALGAGSLLGLLGYALFGQRLPRRGLVIAGFVIRSLTFFVPLWSPGLPVLLGSIVLNATFFEPLNPLLMVIVQERTPAQMRGRVFGTIGALANSTLPLGTLLGGALIGGVGLMGALAVLAGATLAQSLSLPLIPALRSLAPPVKPVGADVE
ncbi:MAG TPA: MFS transporter [Thermomicrobiaceae bacterium]|nr:MFS transporter [Thermomicrobiaceae bacterium]